MAFVIGGSPDDTLLLMPRTLVGGGGRFATYDYGDDRVKQFDSTGQLRWTSGGTGEGPGEFRGNFGLQFDQRGMTWAADPDVVRLTALDDTGGTATLIPLAAERLAGLALVNNEPVVVSSGATTTLLRLSTTGAVVEYRPPPLAALGTLPDFARSVVVASNGGAVWAMAYPYGNLLVVYQGLDHRCIGKLISGQPYPTQPVREPTFSVSAIALVDSTVIVLANGGGEDRGRHLDRYALSDCGYRGSMALPGRFAAMAYDGERFILESHDPVPTVTGLRWRAAPRRR
jgi:hypothetical protein